MLYWIEGPIVALLARRIQNNEAFHRCLGNVRTADGKQQNILGTIKLEISFNNQNKIIEFLVVPSIQHDIICGIDFWKTFGLKIFINEISEVDCVETGSDPDKLKLTKEQHERLNKVIAHFILILQNFIGLHLKPENGLMVIMFIPWRAKKRSQEGNFCLYKI